MQKVALERQLLELAERVKQTQVGCRQLDEEYRSMMKELKGCRSQLEVAQRERNLLLKEQEMTKEEEAVLLEQRWRSSKTINSECFLSIFSVIYVEMSNSSG